MRPETLRDSGTFVQQHKQPMTAAIDEIGRQGNFVGFNEDSDAVLSSPAFHALGPACRHGLLISYIGFVFWDIIVLPMLGSQKQHKLGELGEIIVDRISSGRRHDDSLQRYGREPQGRRLRAFRRVPEPVGARRTTICGDGSMRSTGCSICSRVHPHAMSRLRSRCARSRSVLSERCSQRKRRDS